MTNVSKNTIQKFIKLKLISKYINFIERFLVLLSLPKFIGTKVKYLFELGYWDSRHRLEGEDAFNQEESLKATLMRYCDRLDINKDTFKNKRVIDVGCGPRGTLHYFNAKLKIGVDPLANLYQKFFNVDEQDMIYINSGAENIPLDDNFADFVISVNALDHIDNFKQAIKEIHRILKPEGCIILHLNINKKRTITEPILLNKMIIKNELKEFFNYQIVKETDISSHINIEKQILIKGNKIH